MSGAWWDVLGIPRESDRAAKRRAYAAKLKLTNPEDDPKGFMALRQAYEAALNWVEWDDDWDDGDWVEEAAPVASPAEADEPVAASVEPEQAEPIVAATPAPHEPVEEAFAAERAELRDYTAALEGGLRGPWFKADEELKFYLSRILSAPAMMELETREEIEFWLAELLADTVPRSDRLLLKSIESFGWDREGERPPAVWRVLARLDEWQLMHKLNRGEHDLSDGWKALTQPAGSTWRRRLRAVSPGLVGQVRQLFDLTEWQTPGIVSHMDEGEAEWWRAHLAQPRFGFIDVAVMSVMAVVALVVAAAASAPAVRIGGAAAALLAGAAFPLVRLRLVAPWRQRRDAEHRAQGWGELSWAGLWAGAALLLIWTPIGSVSGGAVVGLSLLAALWMAVAVGREPQIGMSAWRLMSFGALALVGGIGFINLSGWEQAALGAFAVASALIAVCGSGALADLLWRVGEKPVSAAATLALLLAGGAATRFWLPASPPPLVPWGGAAIAGMTILHAVRDAHDGSFVVRFAPLLRWLLWMALVFAAILSTPEPASSADPLTRLEQAEPAMGTMRVTTPAVYNAIKTVSDRAREGELTAEEGQRAIDAIINREYHARLPKANAMLIAAEMDIRLATKREQLSRDPAACVGKPGATSFRASEPLRARQYRHALQVIATPPADAVGLAKGKSIPTAELIRAVTKNDAARVRALTRDLEAADARTQCAAQITFLEALSAQSNEDIAKTMRPALSKRAAGQSAKD